MYQNNEGKNPQNSMIKNTGYLYVLKQLLNALVAACLSAVNLPIIVPVFALSTIPTHTKQQQIHNRKNVQLRVIKLVKYI